MTFSDENAFENVICKLVAILSRLSVLIYTSYAGNAPTTWMQILN